MENINIQTARELTHFFEFVPPERLKKTIVKLFIHYIATTEVTDLEPSTPETAEDLNLLIKTIDKVISIRSNSDTINNIDRENSRNVE